jgi:hypothetical protein
MKAFDRGDAIPGAVLLGIDPSTLLANRPELVKSRLDVQRNLIRLGITRYTMIQVNCEGVIISGNHGARAAAEARVAVDIAIVDFPHPNFGPIAFIPIVDW